MEQSLTIRTNEYSPRTTFVRGVGDVEVPRLRWAPLLNLLQDELGRPTGFRTLDFLIRFEFEHDVLAVFCTQGRRRGEVVVSIDSRNPHIHLLQKVEAAVEKLRAELAEEYKEAMIHTTDDYDEDDEYEDEDEWH